LVLSTEHRAAPASSSVHLQLVTTDGAGGHYRGGRGEPMRSAGRVLDFLPKAGCSREGSSATRCRSRTNAWARHFSRCTTPAGSVACPLVGHASTDRLQEGRSRSHLYSC
jgi:hypothetical protein